MATSCGNDHELSLAWMSIIFPLGAENNLFESDKSMSWLVIPQLLSSSLASLVSIMQNEFDLSFTGKNSYYLRHISV